MNAQATCAACNEPIGTNAREGCPACVRWWKRVMVPIMVRAEKWDERRWREFHKR